MIAVLGATGFIGTPVARALAATGEPVRALVRDETRARALFAGRAGSPGGVDLVVGDMHDPAALATLMAGVRAVYVLVQTVTSPQAAGTGDFAAAERTALIQIVAAARAAGATRLLTVGLIGATSDAPNAWVRARASNEASLLGSGLNVTVLRAGLVAGVGSVGFDSLLTAATKRYPTIRGAGRQRWSYIAVDDLVRYLVTALDQPTTYDQAFDVGSTQTPTYRELLARTAAVLDCPAPQFIPIPLALLKVVAPLVERRDHLPRGGIRAALGHLADNLTGDPTAIRAALPGPLLDWDDAVRRATGAPYGPAHDAARAAQTRALSGGGRWATPGGPPSAGGHSDWLAGVRPDRMTYRPGSGGPSGSAGNQTAGSGVGRGPMTSGSPRAAGSTPSAITRRSPSGYTSTVEMLAFGRGAIGRRSIIVRYVSSVRPWLTTRTRPCACLRSIRANAELTRARYSPADSPPRKPANVPRITAANIVSGSHRESSSASGRASRSPNLNSRRSGSVTGGAHGWCAKISYAVVWARPEELT